MTANGTATAPGDYTATSSPPPVTFAPGETLKTISVPVQGELLDEADETFVVNLSGAVNASVTDTQGLGTITDDDASPTLSIVDAAAVDEGDAGVGSCAPPVTPPFGQCASFTVTLSAASGRNVTVAYATASDSATTGVDFNGVANTLTFDPGETVKTILVPIRGDSASEANETFSVHLANVTNATISDGQALGTIADDDPQPSLSIGDVSSSDEAGSLTFTVTLSPASGQPVTVNAATAGGTATEAVDYQARNILLAFSAGETSKTVNVPLLQDTLDEDAESFPVALSNPSSAAIADGTGLGTITDDDAAPTVSIANAAAVAEGTVASFPLTLSAASERTVTVAYATANGSAVAPGDYGAVAGGSVTFGPGDTSETISVTTANDPLDEAQESFTVTLATPTNATVAAGQGTATGTIDDDDPLPQVSIANAAAVAEGGLASFPVTLSAASGRTVTVAYTSAHGTSAAADFAGALSGTVTFAAGDTSEQIQIQTHDDALDEAQESFTVTLATPTNATVAAGQGTATGTIDDNDPLPQVSIGTAPAVSEGAVASFPVTLSAASGRSVTVEYSTADGSAIEPGDYTAAGGSVTFNAGETSKQIQIQTLDDAFDEPAAEGFTVTLGTPSNATIAAGQGSSGGTINDNDDPPSVSIGNAAPVTEGAAASFPVTLSAASGRTVTVNYSTANGSAFEPADYTAASGTVTFDPGETSKLVPVATIDDTLDEVDAETLTVMISVNASSNATLGSPSSGTATINDNDNLPNLAVGNVTQLEGHSGTTTFLFGVTLSSASGNTVTV